LLLLARPAAALSIVAAENFYGDVAAQIAGPDATVTSVLSNPNQDPHMFEASASVARLLVDASIVVANGADYDPWMTRMLAAIQAPRRTVIVVANLIQHRPGDNPHLWYDPRVMPLYATALTAALAELDPPRSEAYRQRRRAFLASLQPITAKVATLHTRFSGIPVTATEPVFGLMATAIGLRMRNERFQLAVMNNTEPRMSDVAAFETDLRSRAVRLLIYNRQATAPAAERLIGIARQANVPVVGVTETQPAERSYQDWIMDELDAVERALARP